MASLSCPSVVAVAGGLYLPIVILRTVCGVLGFTGPTSDP